MKTKRAEQSVKETPADHFWLELSGPLLKFANHQLQFILDGCFVTWTLKFFSQKKKKKCSKTYSPYIYIASLRCHIAESVISYCILLHHLFSVAWHEAASSFFLTFSSSSFFFFTDFFTDFDLHSFQLFTYVGNSLGVHGDFLLQCRVTVG